MTVTREWVQRIAPYLQLTMLVADTLLRVSGVPLSVSSTLQALLPRPDSEVSRLIEEMTGSVLGELQSLVPIEMTMETTADENMNTTMPESSDNSGSGSRRQPAAKLRLRSEHLMDLRRLFEVWGDPAQPHPRYTGMKRIAQSRRDKSAAWICQKQSCDVISDESDVSTSG